jgi:hypothetical protein
MGVIRFRSHTCFTAGEQIVKYDWKFLSRTCPYCMESLMAAL